MKILKLFLLTFMVLSSAFAQESSNNPEITSDEIYNHIKFLASDEMKGRMSGSDELIKAAEYLKSEFVSYGLKPAFGDSFFQEFEFIRNVDITENNKLSINGNEYALNEDFITAAFSGNSTLKSAEIVFVGYGISAPKLNYDDYENINVEGKLVLALRNHPENDNPHSQFDTYASFRAKASNARDKGAAGIIFVNGFLPEGEEDLSKIRYDNAPGLTDFPVISLSRNAAQNLFTSDSKNLEELQKNINSSKKPSSFIMNNIKANLTTETSTVKMKTVNVAGMVEASNPKFKDEFVVVGAHYDHIGMGEFASFYKGSDLQVHNGADDNASGTTGVLELAEYFASIKDKLNRNMIFVAFSGEELGLLGSSYFVSNPPVGTDKMVGMLNMDMIGRLDKENKLEIIGVGSSPFWKEILENKNVEGLKLSLNDVGMGGSDHQSFINKDVPAVFFFTGIHNDYHRPSDDIDKINSKGQETILNLVAEVAMELDKKETKPEFTKIKQQQQVSMRSKVYIGTIPEYSYQGAGYKLSGVSEGGPAEKAGLKAGDIIIKWGESNIANIYDYMNVMNKHSVGDVVDLIVKRGEEEIPVKLEIGSR